MSRHSSGFCFLPAGACPTVKEEALEYPIGDLLKQHASEYCQDLDLGASRFMDANNRLEGDASGPAPSEGDSKLTLQVDEETLAYHVSLPPPLLTIRSPAKHWPGQNGILLGCGSV